MDKDIIEYNSSGEIDSININGTFADQIQPGAAIAQEKAIELGAKFINLFTISEEGRRLINPETEYVAKFTPKLLELMDEHDVQFLKDKITGDLLPDLYDYTEKGIGGKVRLEVRNSVTAQDLLNFNVAASNLMIQQKLDELVAEIRKIQRIAIQIERGQTNDRFAKVDAGKNTLQQALLIVNDEDLKRRMITEAIALLNEGRALIEKTLLEKLDTIETVPKSVVGRFWKVFISDSYLNDRRADYGSIQEYFYYYCLALEKLASAYHSLGQEHMIEEIVLESKRVLEHSKLFVLNSYEPLIPQKPSEEVWYLNADKYERELIDAYTQNRPIEIAITGRDLLGEKDNEE